MNDKTPIDAALRSRVADLLHLLQFARIETSTPGDVIEAERAISDLKRMLAAPAAPVAQEPVAWRDDVGNLYPSQASVGMYMPKGRVATPLYTATPAADQPDAVKVPRELLAEAESIIDSYAEALKASHAPGGDWDGEEAAQDDYEREAGVAAKLRALLGKEGEA